MAHVFISYVRENQKEVDRLCGELTRHGVKVWLDRNDIKPGSRWKDAVRSAIQQGDFFIACFSEKYRRRDKTFMNEELDLAVAELRKYGPERPWFIPILLGDCNVPSFSISARETLLDIQWVPLFLDWDDGVQRILDVIQPTRIRELIQELKSPDIRVAINAAHELGIIGDSHEDAIDTLADALKHSIDFRLRDEVADALVKIGEPAVCSLIDTLHYNEGGRLDSGEVRDCARNALVKIGKSVVPALIDAINDRDSQFRRFRRHVVKALDEIGTPEALEAIEAYGKLEC